jgi:hypothetical protein
VPAGDGKPCIVGFTPKADGIAVTGNDELICTYYCGQGATFPGLYLRVAPACTVDAVKKTRDTFKQRYDRKEYAAARALLEPVVGQCARTLNRMDGGWIRNDLAITQYRLGDMAACRQTLLPLQKDAQLKDDDVGEGLGPIPQQKYLPVIKAARTNLRLCGAAGKTR